MLPSPPTTLGLMFSLQSFQTLTFTILILPPGCAYTLWLCLFYSLHLEYHSPSSLANSLSAFRKLKHHLFQKAFPEPLSWLQNASPLSAPTVVVLLCGIDLLLRLAPWSKVKALGVSCISLMFACSVFWHKRPGCALHHSRAAGCRVFAKPDLLFSMALSKVGEQDCALKP